jgi:Putative prokaryotic signal transducing protein
MEDGDADEQPTTEAGGDEWVLALQSHDPVEHEMALRFLSDHEIEVQASGGASRAFPSIGLTDLRILVAKRDAARAKEILRAMARGKASDQPFRDGVSGEPYEKPVERRKWPFAVVLAIVVPVGGGHFYARHGAAGVIFAMGILGSFVAGAAFGIPELGHAAVLMVLLDALASPLAVRRFNAGKVPTDGAQRLGALAAIAIANVVAFVAPW